MLVAGGVALLLLFFLFVARDVRRSTRPRALLAEGRWTDARKAAEDIAGSWMRLVPGVRDGARYLVALTRHFEGDLEGSLAELESLATTRDPALRYATRSLEAANLVLLDREPARALEAIREACALTSHAEDALIEAHALRRLGRVEEADRLATASIAKVSRFEEAAARYFRGAYANARADLEAAVLCAPGSVYAQRAEALLAALPAPPPDDDAGPSSLAPQVIGEEARPGSRPPRA